MAIMAGERSAEGRGIRLMQLRSGEKRWRREEKRGGGGGEAGYGASKVVQSTRGNAEERVADYAEGLEDGCAGRGGDGDGGGYIIDRIDKNCQSQLLN